MSINIPKPDHTEEQPNELTRLEIADFSDKKRGTILYERIISGLEGRVKELNRQFIIVLEHNNKLILKDASHQDEVRKNGALQRSSIETNISFGMATLFMVVGGALISSYPINGHNIPWQFAAGWIAIISGFLFGVTSKALAWLVINVINRSGNA